MLSVAIPYRTDPVVAGSELAWILLVTLCLLLAAFLVLAQMRRKGWLERLATRASNGALPQQSRWLVRSQRISRRTSAHTLTRDGISVLVVESAVGLAVTILPASHVDGAHAGTEEAGCV